MRTRFILSLLFLDFSIEKKNSSLKNLPLTPFQCCEREFRTVTNYCHSQTPSFRLKGSQTLSSILDLGEWGDFAKE